MSFPSLKAARTESYGGSHPTRPFRRRLEGHALRDRSRRGWLGPDIGESRCLEAARESLVDQISELPLTVNVVAAERELIEQAQSAAWWASATDEKLGELATRLAPLMRFRQRRPGGMVHLDLQDLLSVKENVEFGPAHEHLSTSAYRARVEAYVRALVADNPVLQKLVAGEPIGDAEVDRLAQLLASHDPYVTEDLVRKVYDHRTARFLQFIKHILGLELLESWSTTVTRAFDQYIAEHNTLGSMQIRFLQTLKTFVLQTGRIEKRDLIEAPFSQIHPKGIRGLFQPAEIDEILALTGTLVDPPSPPTST